MAVIFAKTPKGQEEIEKRGGGLTPRVRRLLIFVDGKRNVEDLHALIAADDLTHTLGLLEEQGYIEAVAAKDRTGKNVPLSTAQQLPAITAFRDLADADSMSLAKARNFMTNTIGAFVGPVGTSTLLDNINKAESHLELRAVFDDWYYVIVSSRDGRREAETLRAKLLEVI
jgi:hypothetical protein